MQGKIKLHIVIDDPPIRLRTLPKCGILSPMKTIINNKSTRNKTLLIPNSNKKREKEFININLETCQNLLPTFWQRQ
jgi:hypothetical protein